MIKGIDVSHWRGVIDWDLVARSGVNFAFSKSSGGVSYADPTYKRNIQGCKDCGILYGAYHYFYPFLGGRKQAEFFVNIIGDDYQLPPVIDSERAYGESWATVAQRTLEALREVERLTGTKPILYSGSWFGSHLGICNEYDLWLAHYTAGAPSVPPGWNSYTFWQYGDRGTVPGVPGYCDMNWYNGTLKELKDYCNIKQEEPEIYKAEINAPKSAEVINLTINRKL